MRGAYDEAATLRKGLFGGGGVGRRPIQAPSSGAILFLVIRARAVYR